MILFEYDGKALDLDDLPLEVYAEIHAATGIAWYEVGSRPLQHANASVLLAKACAKHLGIDNLPTPTPKLAVKWFKFVEGDSRPSEYQDGVPDPKADDPATT